MTRPTNGLCLIQIIQDVSTVAVAYSQKNWGATLDVPTFRTFLQVDQTVVALLTGLV